MEKKNYFTKNSQIQNQHSISKIGAVISTSLVVGNMIGSGIFLLPSTLGAYGGISLVGWIISALGAWVLAKIFAALSIRIPKTGGPYVYSNAGLGEFAGFLVAWGYWISIWCSNAAIAVAMVGYLSVFFPILNTSPVAAMLTGLTAIWFLTWINNRGVQRAGYLQFVTTVLKIIPLLLISIVGLFFLNLDHFFPFNLSGESSFQAIIKTTTLTLFAFLGVECATIPADDTDNPTSTIPKATLYGTAITIAVYILGSIAVMGILPPETLSSSTAPFADAGEMIMGPIAKYLVAAGAIISTFGALNGWILIQGQIPLAAANDRLFPKFFGRLNRHHAPSTGIIISSVLVSLLMLTNYSKGLTKAFEFMILLSTLTVLIPYLFSSAAYLILVNKEGRLMNSRVILGSAAFLFSIFAIAGSGMDVVYWGFLLLVSGIPFYIMIKKAKS